jgi:hypothetical protein
VTLEIRKMKIISFPEAQVINIIGQPMAGSPMIVIPEPLGKDYYLLVWE